MFGTSGIRGAVGEEVTATLAVALGRAVGVDCERVVVGRDTRDSGDLLVDALAAGLRETATTVVDIGVATTPTVARSVDWEDADAGVTVTASHNPPADNGFKLWQRSGQAFDEPLRERITGRIEAAAWDLQPWNELGERVHSDGTERHLAALDGAVSLGRPSSGPPTETSTPGGPTADSTGETATAGDGHTLSVVVDVGNGPGTITADALDSLGCAVETLNAQPDGAFPGRPSEPTAEHCRSLATLVGETDADLGIAHDGDADRMRAVAGDGTFLSGDVLLAIFARDAAAAGERVAVPVDTSLAVEDHLAAAGIETVRTRVGDVYVAATAREPDVAFGGEPSGAWIWPDETLCPDGPLAACRIVALAAETPLTERQAAIETYPIRREAVPVADKESVMSTVRDRADDIGGSVSTIDGIRVDFEDAWFLVRPSGTEPVVRITAEARDGDRADAVFEQARSLLPV